MFPIRDTIRSRSVPLVTWLIIAANTLVFFYELNLSPLGLERFYLTYALVPAKLSLLNPLTWLPLLTHMFLHSGWLHFLSNMWVLFIFGDNAEDRMGSWRFIIFYILGGLAAAMLQIFFDAGSQVPTLGASGAIAAVMGAYFFYYPKARVLTLIPIFIFPLIIEVPALVYLGFWFVSQLFSGLASLSTASGAAAGGVAWWAHIGGFIFGLILATPFAAFRPPYTWHKDQYWPY